MKIKTIGVLTGGGDCPGLNAALRAVTKTAITQYGMRVIGFEDGYEGLVTDRFRELTYDDVSGILTLGGTILGTSNIANPFHFPLPEGRGHADLSVKAIGNAKRLGISALISIGGDGTLAIAQRLMKKGLSCIGVAKTIDNDLNGTDITFGFDSAITTAADAIDKLRTTAESHHRVMILEVMGRYAGWVALAAGIVGGGDIILIPEIPYRREVVARVVQDRHKKGRRFSIIVVAEGARPRGGDLVVDRRVKGSPDPIRLGGVGRVVGRDIEKITGLETRVTVLGHLQRVGEPTVFDRILATRFGEQAVHCVARRRFGRMVGLNGRRIVSIPLSVAIGKRKCVPRNSPLIRTARAVGTCFGI